MKPSKTIFLTFPALLVITLALVSQLVVFFQNQPFQGERYRIEDIESAQKINYSPEYDIFLEEENVNPQQFTEKVNSTHEIGELLSGYQKGLVEFPVRLGNLSYDSKELMTSPQKMVYHNGTYYNLSLRKYPESEVNMTFDAELLDVNAEKKNPAEILLKVTNNGEKPVVVSAGVFSPFDYLHAKNQYNEFLLWSDLYDERIKANLTDYKIGVIPAVGRAMAIGSGENFTAVYQITPEIEGVESGNYTSGGSFEVASFMEDANISEEENVFRNEMIMPYANFSYSFSFKVERNN